MDTSTTGLDALISGNWLFDPQHRERAKWAQRATLNEASVGLARKPLADDRVRKVGVPAEPGGRIFHRTLDRSTQTRRRAKVVHDHHRSA